MITYRPGFIPHTFIIIGAGGTGSRLVPLLAQFLKTITWINNPDIILIDHDTVEDKNLLRQNFIKPDIGRLKATVLAERYSRAFDINIWPVVLKIENSNKGPVDIFLNDTKALALHGLSNAIVILAVDSVEARKDILSHISNSRAHANLFIIDSGNENDFGQIQLFNPVNVDTCYSEDLIKKSCTLDGKLVPIDIEIPRIPIPQLFYRDIVDGPVASCADLDQTLAINAAMATTIMGIVQSFIYSKKIPFHRLNVNLLNGIIPEYITLQYLMDRSKGRINGGIGAPAISLAEILADLMIQVEDFKTSKNLALVSDLSTDDKVAMEAIALRRIKKKAGPSPMIGTNPTNVIVDTTLGIGTRSA
jgi:molybdopterin/thiamine biosynthesis adenylyltransferase